MKETDTKTERESVRVCERERVCVCERERERYVVIKTTRKRAILILQRVETPFIPP